MPSISVKIKSENLRKCGCFLYVCYRVVAYYILKDLLPFLHFIYTKNTPLVTTLHKLSISSACATPSTETQRLKQVLGNVWDRPQLTAAWRTVGVDWSGCIHLLRAQTSIGQRRFAVYEPTVWNSLLSALRDNSLSLDRFGRRLNSYRFGG